MCFWHKRTGTGAATYQYVNLYPTTTNNTRVEFYNYNGNAYFCFSVPDGQGGGHAIYPNLGAHGNGVWHHYAIARKGTTVTFYRDGAAISSDTNANNNKNLVDSGDRLLIGWFGEAVLDDFRALRKGLTTAEIGAIYNGGAGTAALDSIQNSWDALNHLREARDPNTGALLASYLYDADNRRVRKILAGAGGGPASYTTDFLYDGWRVLEERNGAAGGGGAIQRQFIYGNYLDEVLVMDCYSGAAGYDATKLLGAAAGSFTPLQGATRYFYHQNTLFSVCAVTDSTAKIVEAYEYDPYGRHVLLRDGNSDGRVNFDSTDLRLAMGASALGNPNTFTGQRFDPETGLHYYKNRYYSCTQGRFISRDPALYKDGSCLYQYVKGMPTVADDPLGLWMPGDHKSFTNIAVDYALSFLRAADASNKEKKCLKTVKKRLVSANTGMDGWGIVGGASTHLHYVRNVNNDSVDEAKKDYVLGLDEREMKWFQIMSKDILSKGDCLDALKQLGEASHMWQDYYAHGVDAEGEYNSAELGNPHGLTLFPSTYRLVGRHQHSDIQAKKHPGRIGASLGYTTGWFSTVLPEWYEKCSCPVCGMP